MMRVRGGRGFRLSGRLVVVVALLGSFFVSGLAHAQPPRVEANDPEIDRLKMFFGEGVVVSVPATKPEPISEAMAPVFVITEEEIRNRGYRDLADVLHDLPGVDIASQTTGERATNVLFRGIFANNKIVVLRDGVPISFAMGRLFVLGRNVPLYNIKRIEVLYGPASVIYGADAFAAVIQLVSKDPKEMPLLEMQLAAGSMNPSHGWDRYAVDSHVSVGKQLGPVGLMAGVRTYQSNGPNLLEAYPASYRDIQTLPAPYTNRYETPMRSWNVEGQLNWRGLTVGIYFTDHAWSSSSGFSSAPPFSYAYVNDAVWRYRFIQGFARHELKLGPVHLLTTLTYGDLKTASETAYYDFGGVFYKFLQQSSIRLDHRTVWDATRWLSVTLGGRLQTFNAIPRSIDQAQPVTGSGDLSALGLNHLIFNRYGAFALLDFTPWKDLKLSAGVSVEYDGNGDETVVLPRGGVILRLDGGKAYLKALYGEAYLASVPDDQYQTFGTPGQFVHLTSLQLGSERIRTAELVYSHQIRRIASVELSAYYNRATNLVQIVQLGPTMVNGVDYASSEANRNLGTVWSAGGELNLRVAAGKWLEAIASYALVFGQETLPTPDGEATYALSKIGRHKLLAGFTVRPIKHVVLDMRLRYVEQVGTRPTNAIYGGQLAPGYCDINLNLRIENIVRGLDAHLLIENLTDRRYYHFGVDTEAAPALPRTPQAPFRFLAGLTYRPFR